MPRLSATNTTTTSSPIIAVDLDDAKYDRRVKRTLIRRRKQQRQRRRHSTSSSLTFVVVVVVVLSIVGMLMLSIRHRQAQTQHDTYHRLQRAQQLQRQRKRQQQQEEEETDAAELPAAYDTNNNNNNSMDDDDVETTPDPAAAFAAVRENDDVNPSIVRRLLQRWLALQDHNIQQNLYATSTSERWARPYLLPPLPLPDGSNPQSLVDEPRPHRARRDFQSFFAVRRSQQRMAWEDEMITMEQQQELLQGPAVDYTDPELYQYPEVVLSSNPQDDENYPPLQTLQHLMDHWPQDQDFDGTVLEESLLHFNYSNPDEMRMAEQLRDAELPFKLYNVPDLDAANEKWTDEYVSLMFDSRPSRVGNKKHHASSSGSSNNNNKLPIIVDGTRFAPADGQTQESTTNYFAFFVPQHWYVPTFGIPPTRNNDWTFATWARHARYADSVRLGPGHPHFYFQAGVPREERHGPPDQWSFITRDLPTFSATATEPNFIVFHPEAQKGIQCRFGERGVVAATHYDGGRNMVGMITGAKRYILSPPHQCSRLGIFTERTSPIYRHSLLNFGHLNNDHHSDDENGMSPEERAWLDRAADSMAVETVLKAGEVLYIPSHWFHYIVSLQKSAQCNVRSGIEHGGNPRFGGRQTVDECADVPLADTGVGAQEY